MFILKRLSIFCTLFALPLAASATETTPLQNSFTAPKKVKLANGEYLKIEGRKIEGRIIQGRKIEGMTGSTWANPRIVDLNGDGLNDLARGCPSGR